MTDVVLGYSRKIVCGLEPGWFGHKRNTNEVSQNLITVARSTGIRTVQQLVQVSNLHATGVDPLEPGSFLRDPCDESSTHSLCPSISVRSGLARLIFPKGEFMEDIVNLPQMSEAGQQRQTHHCSMPSWDH